MTRRPAIAWVEEWMSWRACNVLPSLAKRFDVIYVTAGDDVPPADFRDVRKVPKWRHMMLAGFSLSRSVDELYHAGQIDLAVVYASIGFAIRHTPFVSVEGGSVYQELMLFSPRQPWYRRPRSWVGFVHYAIPEMLCVRRARHVVVNSRTLKRELSVLHRLPDDRISVILNGVSRDYLDLFAEQRPPLLRRALYVGRLHFRKGILKVLEEFVRHPEIDIEFVIAGDGPDRRAVERLSEADQRIRYVGFVSPLRVRQLLASAQVFVFPTLYDPQPSALLEAMAAGLTCLTYDFPMLREVLGDVGITVPYADVTALVRSVATVFEQPEEMRRYGEAAHARAKRYSWEMCAQQFADLLDGELERQLERERE